MLRFPGFIFLALLLSSHSNAFVLSGNFWESGQATFHVGMSGTAPSGTSWNTAFKRSMDAWSNATNFQFIAVDSYLDPCIGRQNNGFGDNITGVDFTPSVCGNAFGTNVLAVTLTAGTCQNQQCSGGFKITDADIVFKNDEPWDVYTGALKPSTTDFERVALHELGHALGLRHESTNAAIMQALVNDNHNLTSDDINGANAIYTSGISSLPTVSTIYGIDVILPATSNLLGPNDSVNFSGSLTNTDPSLDGKFIDLYQFTFARDSIIDLQATATTIDPFLYLVRVSSTQDAVPGHSYTDDNSGAGNNARIATPVQAGTYWIGVTTAAIAQQGNYDVSLIATTANPSSSFQSFQSIYGVAIQINPNPTISDSLLTTDFQIDGKHLDLYQFTVLNQTTLRIDLSSAEFDTVLLLTRVLPSVIPESQLLDESFLLQNDDFEGIGNSRIEQVLVPGTYWIGVTSFDTGETGDYQITSTVILP